MADARLVGVLDVGKTNVKLLVLDRQGRIRDEAATPSASLPGPPYPHLDSEGVWRWLLDRLAVMAARWPIDTLVVTTHGGAAALVDERGLVLPILDYEFEPPDDGFADAYRAIAPSFAETFAPLFPAGLNLARQIFWQQQAFPEASRRVRHILCYPQYLAWRAKEANFTTRFIDTAEQVNTKMPSYTVSRVSDLLNSRGLPVFATEILGVGIAYKPNIADDRESAALEVLKELTTRGARVSVFDPVVGNDRIRAHGYEPVDESDDLSHFQVAVVLTDHSGIDYAKLAETIEFVFDTRGVYRRLGLSAPNVEAL